MSSKSKTFSNEKLFTIFHDNTKDSPIEVIQGAHRFMMSVVKKQAESPKNSILIDILNDFCHQPIKPYVFKRMGKKMLLELALCILQEIVQHGPARARTLQLVVERAAAGGKTVRIAEDDDEIAEAEDLQTKNIDEASFRLHDSSGNSPDVTFRSGQGLSAPFEPADAEGNFTTPRKSSASRSLVEEFDSAASAESPAKSFEKSTAPEKSTNDLPVIAITAPKPWKNGKK